VYYRLIVKYVYPNKSPDRGNFMDDIELFFTAPCIVCFSTDCEKLECLLKVELKNDISGYPLCIRLEHQWQ